MPPKSKHRRHAFAVSNEALALTPGFVKALSKRLAASDDRDKRGRYVVSTDELTSALKALSAIAAVTKLAEKRLGLTKTVEKQTLNLTMLVQGSVSLANLPQSERGAAFERLLRAADAPAVPQEAANDADGA